MLALLLNRSCDGFAADMACGREERGRRPQHGQSLQMGKFLAQETRRASHDKPGDMRWKRRREGAHKQVNLIGLKRQFDQLPLVLMDKLMNNLFSSLFHRSTKKSTPICADKRSDDRQVSGHCVDHAGILSDVTHGRNKVEDLLFPFLI